MSRLNERSRSVIYKAHQFYFCSNCDEKILRTVSLNLSKMQSVMNRRQIFFCPGNLYLVKHKTTGTCIVIVLIELHTYLFNFSGEDSEIDFD